MRKLFIALGIFFASVSQIEAQTNYAEVYPAVMQALIGTTIFSGDRHGQFAGDYVAILADGSQWKIHPDSRALYSTWQPGETVRITERTDFYWFKREHKFALYNHHRGEFVKVMLVHHIDYPYPLQVVYTECYAKSIVPVQVIDAVYEMETIDYDVYGNEIITIEVVEDFHYEYRECDFRLIIQLSDGSFWVIKDVNNFYKFRTGSRVFVGAQGRPGHFYDFILITGDQREASLTYARPQF